VKNRGCERGIGRPFGENFQEMFGRLGPAGGDDGHAYSAGDGGRQRNVKAALRAVAIYRSEQDLSCATRYAFFRPFDCIEASGFAAAANAHFPPAAIALRVDSEHHGLRAKIRSKFRQKFWPRDRGGVYGHFIRAGADDRARILKRSNSTAGRERDGELLSHAANGFEKRGPAVARGCDIEDHEFVCTFGVIPRGERDGIAGVAQPDKIHALHDARAVRIEAGNDSVREAHCVNSRKLARTRAPGAADFSGWNCTAQMFSDSIAAMKSVPCEQNAATLGPSCIAA